MKTRNIFLFWMSFVGAAMAFVSCDTKEPEIKIEPIFPEAVTKTVTPGEEVTLTFDANLDWEVSVPENTLKSFWIKDGAFTSYKLKGNAGNAVVVIGVTEIESFEEFTCDVTLTMDGQSKVIATLVRSAKEALITVYAAQVSDGEILFADDGSDYLYGDEEPENIGLIWTGSDFRLPIQVTANCNWTYDAPDWVSIDVPEDGVGTSNVVVLGVPSEYPLEAESGKISFKVGDNVVKEYNISIPGCEDIFSYSVEMSLTEVVYNYAGKIKTITGFVDGPVTASISGTSGVEVFAVEVIDGKYQIGNPEGPEWLEVAVEDYDTTSGADVLQTRKVTVAAETNEGNDRFAAVFFMPPTGWESIEDVFNDSLETVKDEFVAYMLPVTQLSINQEFITMLSAPSEMAENGAEFKVSEDQSLLTKFGETKFAYDLHYTNRYASDYARMYFSSPVTSYKVFDASGNDLTDSEDFFLSVSVDEDMTGGVVHMDSDSKSSGYVVFYGKVENVLAVIRCTIDPEKIIEEVPDVTFLGESEMYAPMVGATLKHLTEGPVYDQYKEYGVPVYHLTYTMENMPMLISIPATIKSYMPNPWALINNFRINGMDFDDGSFERIDGGVQVYMTMPEGKTRIDGNIMFYTSRTPNNEKISLILVCTLDLTSESVE